MQWVKKGRIFDPEAHRDWVLSHAQVPTPLLMTDRVRLFYADRDERGKSFPTWVDVDRSNPLHVIGSAGGPVMGHGIRGMFDDEGIMPGTVLEHEGQLWMYYTGWNQGVTVPYRNSTGLAFSVDGGATFKQMYPGPILDRATTEPLMIVTPFVLREGQAWRMWYVAGTKWVTVDERLEPVYVIRHAISNDGVNWIRSGVVCVEQRNDQEAHAHPTVHKVGSEYHMWFSYRSSIDYRDGSGSYRIGYARSSDGIIFERFDEEAGIALSDTGWDSKMMCYPYVIAFDGNVHMFYNGNGFGRSGIGYAVLEKQ